MFHKRIRQFTTEPLERLNFFYQILIIIGLMTTFLVIQVYWGFHIINKIELISSNVYGEVMEGMSLLQETQSRLNQLQVAYLKDITNDETVSRMIYDISIAPTLGRVSDTLKTKFPETALTLQNEMGQLRHLMKMPVNPKNYHRLEKILTAVNLKLNSFMVSLQYNTSDSMLTSKRFSANARNFIVIVLVVGSIIVTSTGLCFAFIATRRNEKAKFKTLQAEFNSLQAQMNPHFLYNTLETINCIAKINHQEEIAEIISALARLLRTSIKGKNAIISLGQEIKYTRDYLYIQQIALGDRIQIEYDIDEEVLDCSVPKLIMQPIIENAIVHGIEGMKNGGLIVISAYHKGDLLISVSDNGKGIEEERINQILDGDGDDDTIENHTRLGIRSVDKRVKILYGEKYGVKILSQPQQGTTVELLIPLYKGGV